MKLFNMKTNSMALLLAASFLIQIPLAANTMDARALGINLSTKEQKALAKAGNEAEEILNDLYTSALKTLKRHQADTLKQILDDVNKHSMDTEFWFESFFNRGNKKPYAAYVYELKEKIDEFEYIIIAPAFRMHTDETDPSLKKAFGIIYELLKNIHAKLESLYTVLDKLRGETNAIAFVGELQPTLDFLASAAENKKIDAMLNQISAALSKKHSALAQSFNRLKIIFSSQRSSAERIFGHQSGVTILGHIRHRIKC